HTPLPRIMQHAALLRDPRPESRARQQWRFSRDPSMRELLRPTARVKCLSRAVSHSKPARRRVHANGILTLRSLRALFRQQKLIDLQVHKSCQWSVVRCQLFFVPTVACCLLAFYLRDENNGQLTTDYGQAFNCPSRCAASCL